MKTISLKKVSAVAVASLGFGLLSVVPANAALSTADAVTSISVAKVTSTPTVGTAVAVNFGAVMAADFVGTTRFVAALETYPAGGNVSVLGVVDANGTTELGASDTVTTGGVVVTDPLIALGVTASATAGNASFSFTPTKAGTYNMVVWNDAGTTPDGILTALEVRQSISLTVVAKSDLSTSTSTAFIRGDNTAAIGDATTDAAGASATATAGTANAGSITVSLKDAANVAMTSGNTLSATVTGPGYVLWVTGDNTPQVDQCSATPTYGATLGRSITAQAADAVGTLYVCADGASGVTTVVITVANAAGVSQALSTKTVTFFGAVTKIVATGVLTVGRLGGFAVGVDTGNRNASTVIPSVIIKATDKNGVTVTGLTGGITAVSSDATVMTSTVTNNPDTAGATASSGGAGFYNVATNTATSSKSGGKATLTFRVVDPAGDGTTFLTSTVDFTIGGTVATEVLSFDKASYAPGEAMVVTVTAKDSVGNPVADGTASPAITFSKAVGGTAPGASVYVGGKKSTSATAPTVFAPVIGGAFSALATSGNTAKSAITASSSVTDGSTAVNTRIDSLNAKIVALTALIAKIMKSLKIK